MDIERRNKTAARPRITEPSLPGAPKLQQRHSGCCGGEITAPSMKTQPDRVKVTAGDTARQENPPDHSRMSPLPAPSHQQNQTAAWKMELSPGDSHPQPQE